MSEPFLILHKVRGELAFDIAEQMIVEGYEEPWWIIPTSGHRAYPAWWGPLSNFRGSGTGMDGAWETLIPVDLPDHYAASETRSRLATAASDILSLMGIGKAKPQEPVKRRVIP
jgi:hypothetical protein